MISGSARHSPIIRFAGLNAVVVAIGLFATACGGDDLADACEENGVSISIADNHPTGSHILVIPTSDVGAGLEVTYDIQGDNTGHGHTVTVSSADFTALNEGTNVTITSSDTGAVGMDHTHEITLACES